VYLPCDKCGHQILKSRKITFDDFVPVDLLFQYPVIQKERFTGLLSAGLENLLDEEYRKEFNFPAPGRIFHAGAEVRF
jgi:outer membrane cobalamin receptor